MDFMKLIGTVLAFCYNPGYALKGFASQRICRRGTEKPCYKIVYHHNKQFRVGFDVATWACREDNGELLSIETESEQRLVERFVQDLLAPDGDFWIGLRRRQASSESGTGGCSSQYYWLDYSQSTFRNWLSGEPSCGSELCAALYHRAPSLVTPHTHYMFRWTDANCNAKNNFICKYATEKSPQVTPAGNSTTRSGESAGVYYVLMAGLPVLLLLTLLATGFFCYRVLAKKRKEPSPIYAEPGSWVSATGRSPRTTRLEYMSSEINGTASGTRPGCHGDYENLPGGGGGGGGGGGTAAGFVTNDIYETCRSPGPTEAGWVDNDIYGY